MREKEAAAKKGPVEPSKKVLKERRSKAAADSASDVVKVAGRRGGSVAGRSVLPMKTLSLARSRLSTAGLALSRKVV